MLQPGLFSTRARLSDFEQDGPLFTSMMEYCDGTAIAAYAPGILAQSNSLWMMSEYLMVSGIYLPDDASLAVKDLRSGADVLQDEVMILSARNAKGCLYFADYHDSLALAASRELDVDWLIGKHLRTHLDDIMDFVEAKHVHNYTRISR